MCFTRRRSYDVIFRLADRTGGTGHYRPAPFFSNSETDRAVTPNIAGASTTTVRVAAAMVAEEVRRFANGEGPLNPAS